MPKRADQINLAVTPDSKRCIERLAKDAGGRDAGFTLMATMSAITGWLDKNPSLAMAIVKREAEGIDLQTSEERTRHVGAMVQKAMELAAEEVEAEHRRAVKVVDAIEKMDRGDLLEVVDERDEPKVKIAAKTIPKPHAKRVPSDHSK